MKQTTIVILLAVCGLAVLGGAADGKDPKMKKDIKVYSVEQGGMIETTRIDKSDAEWKEELSPEVYKILRRKGTEMACSGAYWKNDSEGVYRCAGCGTDLFVSSTKFTSSSGWPSFFQPVHDANIGTMRDTSFNMIRIEVHCERCGGHLGHIFDDGPKPTGKRYCINSLSLDFVEIDVDGE